jgi:ABC-type uncharacterized transport system ATPase subunit
MELKLRHTKVAFTQRRHFAWSVAVAQEHSGVNPGERWGIVGINGAGVNLWRTTGTVRTDEGKALVHSKA